jgi:hypothetical protein
MGPENLRKITPAAGVPGKDLVLQTFTAANIRTQLYVVQSRARLCSLLSSRRHISRQVPYPFIRNRPIHVISGDLHIPSRRNC